MLAVPRLFLFYLREMFVGPWNVRFQLQLQALDFYFINFVFLEVRLPTQPCLLLALLNEVKFAFIVFALIKFF